jgi:hypothetical protein
MPLWTRTKPPVFAPQCKATPQGWKDPQTGEIFVAARELSVKAGPATVRQVIFDNLEPIEGQPFQITVVFSEAVNVLNEAEIELESTNDGSVLMTAQIQNNVTRVVFEGVAPAFPNDITLSPQLDGFYGIIVDADSQGLDANTIISADLTSAAGVMIVQEDV